MKQALLLVGMLLLGAGCHVNSAPAATPATHLGRPSAWIAPGVRTVQGANTPVFETNDGQRWLHHEGDWHVWREVGWKRTTAPVELTRLAAPRGEWGWARDLAGGFMTAGTVGD